MIAMLAANATTSLNIITTTLDPVRNGSRSARVALQLGTGEIKQCNPLGYKRSQGLSRMEDIYAITAGSSSRHLAVPRPAARWHP